MKPMQFCPTAMMRMATAGALLALCACAGEEPAVVHEENELGNAAGKLNPLDRGIYRYFVSIPVTICPDPSDLHSRIDQLMLGNPDQEPPEQCRMLPAGAVLLMELPGHRRSVEYREFPIEQAMLPDGTLVWSDELGTTNVQLIGNDGQK